MLMHFFNKGSDDNYVDFEDGSTVAGIFIMVASLLLLAFGVALAFIE